MRNNKTKCSFCHFWTGSGCMVTPSPINCREAINEYYQYIKGEQSQQPIKSFRKWDKR